jgi:hypothetical protein
MAVCINLSSGTNRLTRPIFSASFASTVLPESKISAARARPTSLGKKLAEPQFASGESDAEMICVCLKSAYVIPKLRGSKFGVQGSKVTTDRYCSQY